MFARFGWTETDAAGLDAVVAAYETSLVPQVLQSGRLPRNVCVCRPSERSTAPRFIARAVEASGVRLPTVARYEVVLRDLDGKELG